MRIRIALSVIVVSLIVGLGFAQSSRTDIRGVVKDGAGAVLPGVLVTLTGPEQRSTATGRDGQFTFQKMYPDR